MANSYCKKSRLNEEQFNALLSYFVQDELGLIEIEKEIFGLHGFKYRKNSLSKRFIQIRRSLRKKKEYFADSKLFQSIDRFLTEELKKDILRISKRNLKSPKWREVYWVVFDEGEVRLRRLYYNKLKLKRLLLEVSLISNPEIQLHGLLEYDGAKLVNLIESNSLARGFEDHVNGILSKKNGVQKEQQYSLITEAVFRYNIPDAQALFEELKNHLREHPI